MINMKREMGKKLIAAQHVYEYILYSRLFDPLFIYTINGQQRWPKRNGQQRNSTIKDGQISKRETIQYYEYDVFVT